MFYIIGKLCSNGIPLRFSYISQAPRLTQLPEDVFVGVPETFRSLYEYFVQHARLYNIF